MLVGDGFPVPIRAKTDKTHWNPTSLDSQGFYFVAVVSCAQKMKGCFVTYMSNAKF